MIKDINSTEFKKLIFDYEDENQEEGWNFKGDKPTVIDFHADWCGPCKIMAPGLEELSDEYEGKVDFYKVDIDASIEVAKRFQVTSVPSLFFIPIDGMPEMAVGALPKPNIEEAVKKILDK